MIRSRLGVLLAEKSHAEGRKITYETVVKETGLSKSTLVRLNAANFGTTGDGVRMDTLDTLCDYFGCAVGDILEHVSGEKAE